MNCECLNFNRTKIAEHYAKRGVVNPDVSENFLGINFETGESVIALTYTIRGDNKPYNTVKGKSLSMVASFCPWCGKPTARIKPDGDAAPSTADSANTGALGDTGGEA